LPDPQAKLNSTQRFSDRVQYYVQSRPRYPRAILDFCRTDLSLRPSDQIADIGSGTGFLSELFLQNGNPVFGVEPNEPMRLAAERGLRGFAGFHSINGTAEQTGLPAGSFGFIVAGQAFHWFDRAASRTEFSRILQPRGVVLLIWNEREKNDDDNGFAAAYDAVVREFQTDWNTVRHENITTEDSRALGDFFGPAGFELRKFDNPQPLNLDGVLARALSSSYLPLPGQPRCEEMLDQLREIFRVHAQNEQVIQRYTAKVYYGRLS